MMGALIIDKPAGWTSYDVVAKVRRAARTRRVGHAGTLDPFATGILVLCTERATRLLQFLVGLDKEYLATVRLGFATDTQDLTGEQITALQSSDLVSVEQVQTVLQEFIGEQLQTPPMFSAKKVAGERLYRAAREGREVEREPVGITVHALDLLDFQDTGADGTRDFVMRVHCGSGTYVRTLAHDIGARLGTGAHLSALRRTAVGRFRVEDALTLEAIEQQGSEGTLESSLIAPAAALEHLPMMQIGTADLHHVMNGRELPLTEADGDALENRNALTVRVCDKTGELVAIGEVDKIRQVVKPRVVLKTDD